MTDLPRLRGPAKLSLSAADPDVIERSERAGGAELVKSRSVPTEMLGATQEQFEALGLRFGDPYEDDPLFRDVELPEGWTRQMGDNPYGYWTYLVDENGVDRVAIFYKAAFYDRSAHMSLVTP